LPYKNICLSLFSPSYNHLCLAIFVFRLLFRILVPRCVAVFVVSESCSCSLVSNLLVTRDRLVPIFFSNITYLLLVSLN
jgi:hypothetical protein